MFQYLFSDLSKIINIARRFEVSADDPDDDDADADVDVSVSDNRKSQRIVRRKITDLGGIQ